MKGISKLLALTAMVHIASGVGATGRQDKRRKLNPNNIDPIPNKTTTPKGCKEYSFHDGEFTTVAISEKSAFNKYKKWLKNK
jgi:hypothetical protein